MYLCFSIGLLLLCTFKTAHMLTFFLGNHSDPAFASISGHLVTSSLGVICFANVLPLSQLLGQALDRLVTVSSIRCRTSTSALSTSSSSRGLTS